MAKNGYGQSDDRTLKLAVSQKGTDGIDFLHAGTNSCKLKDDF